MWLEKSTAMYMMDAFSGKVEIQDKKQKYRKKVHDSYAQQLDKMKEFPSASFHQIYLDVPRLKLADENRMNSA